MAGALSAFHDHFDKFRDLFTRQVAGVRYVGLDIGCIDEGYALGGAAVARLCDDDIAKGRRDRRRRAVTQLERNADKPVILRVDLGSQ